MMLTSNRHFSECSGFAGQTRATTSPCMVLATTQLVEGNCFMATASVSVPQLVGQLPWHRRNPTGKTLHHNAGDRARRAW